MISSIANCCNTYKADPVAKSCLTIVAGIALAIFATLAIGSLQGQTSMGVYNWCGGLCILIALPAFILSQMIQANINERLLRR